MLELNIVSKYLEEIKEIKKSHRFYDCHVHPFNIFSQIKEYQKNPYNDKIYSLTDAKFKMPELTSITEETIDSNSFKSIKKEFIRKLILLQCKKYYGHIGSAILMEYMDICSIDESLLLPVPNANEDFDDQLNFMEFLFGKNSRFKLGASIPNGILNKDIHQYIRRLTDRFPIIVIKIHPIITGIDLSSKYGIERIENILDACDECELAMIIHGGASFLYGDRPESTYSEIENLERINWNISKFKIVIAHAACYDCELNRIENIILPKLKKLLEKYSNLVVDISALGYLPLSLVLKNIEINRIIFGSDALYYSQWSGIVKLYDILKKMYNNSDEYFLKIISKNPTETVFKE